MNVLLFGIKQSVQLICNVSRLSLILTAILAFYDSGGGGGGVGGIPTLSKNNVPLKQGQPNFVRIIPPQHIPLHIWGIFGGHILRSDVITC